ncbi:MAG: hypothetical protein FWH37_05150 [Candidatus Bathyarchaeota archaeon]|nr:hypothetical protein [Candidatus Termiticorpusculum sp.]
MSKYSYIPQFSKGFREAFINKKENRVAVLGSSEMWPLVHKICLDVVACGFVAVTSRYIYFP